jgi:two-component system, NarL family, invasion response regulator UvrY
MPHSWARMNATASRTVRVLTVDDQAVFRSAAREVIAATPGFEALAEAASAAEGLAMIETLEPDLVLMDVRMPGMDGIEATRRVTAAAGAPVVVLISLEDPDDVEAVAHGCGAVATVRKQDFCPALLRRLWGAHGAS